MAALRFEPADGLVVVPTAVWGPLGYGRRFRFVIDTGTGRTMLSEDGARFLGFAPEMATRTSRVASVLGTELGYLVLAPRVHALGWDRSDFEVACHRFAPEAQIDGLLGADFFAARRLVIDYGISEVELLPSR
jgi:predicted aspartyl protease